MPTISSRPKKFLWYHKFVLAAAPIAACALIYLAYKNIETGATNLFGFVYEFTGLLFLVWAVYSQIEGTIVATYDSATLLTFRSGGLKESFPFSKLKTVLRRSPGCVVLIAQTEEAGFAMLDEYGVVMTDELTIRGHDDDIANFCQTLTAAQVPLSDDGIGDDPPEKITVILIIGGLMLALIIYLAFCLKIAR